ncbi:hypothetical protein EV421DRAFT_1911438 [Armillaria borealis]|uniref:Protein kinase domain-containing protein n=1 Tax=Armillaria borealis TaxID=47425 RepID=A0AA39MF23_9AGAR|nr:hypothetical protein EV421DRAFT_1911438 [Armillaria borealis]
MPADDFFTNILHLPQDWRANDEIQTLIATIKNDPTFRGHVKTYLELRDKNNPKSGEKAFHHPHGLMFDSTFDALGATENYGLGHDANPVVGGSQDIPDSWGVLRAMFGSSGNLLDAMRGNGSGITVSWAQTMHWQEFEPDECYLYEGSDAIYSVLMADGKDPRVRLRRKPILRYDPGSILPPTWSYPSSYKRRSEADDASCVPLKYARTGTTHDISEAWNATEALGSVKEEDDEAQQEEISQARRHMQLQCSRYALEILSGAGFRTHCIGALVARGRIQPLYYDRSAIIVCKPVDMFERDANSQDTDVTDAFVAMLVGLGRLTLKQRGIQEEFYDNRALKGCVDRYGHPKAIFAGVKLMLVGGGGNVEVTLDRIISRHPDIVGRGTCVVEAASEHEGWKGKRLIVKISWPDISRTSEADFVGKAREKARTMTQGKRPDWALDHLPDILLSQDFDYDADSTQANLVTFFGKAMFAGEKLECEGRVCRITVQERLHPLDELQTAQEFAQVFFDILQNHARILHRDISTSNIMWRRTVSGHLRGVLNDFDLSSFRDDTGTSSIECTGTLPYMAYELFIDDENGNPGKHLYRHDLESIFYVILLLCCRCELVTAQKSPEREILVRTKVHSQFDKWYRNGRDSLLMASKCAVFMEIFEASPRLGSGFTDFQPWIDGFALQFARGFCLRTKHKLVLEDYEPENEVKKISKPTAMEPFDDETLKGCVSYSAIVDICSKFAGPALVVHNDQLEVA